MESGARMVRDFWPSGIGLAAWPEIFARYAPAPWSPNFLLRDGKRLPAIYRRDGYRRSAAGRMARLLIVTRLSRGLPKLSSTTRSIEAALIAGLAVIAVVEFFDFDLQIPANAFTLRFSSNSPFNSPPSMKNPAPAGKRNPLRAIR